ncbi:hypothetical protein C2E23DRAFT_713248, partial [Lenzites betulinus]
MWLQSYLVQGDARPWWAFFADALFAHYVPKDCKVKDISHRVNPFLQHWKPSKRALPPELRSMITAATRYGLRPEGLAFARITLRRMPMWDHCETDATVIHRLAARSAVTTCLRHKHRLLTVGDFETFAANLNDPTHHPVQNCVCATCERLITEGRCAYPHRCLTRAKAFLDALPPKWDPRREHPEDYEDAQTHDRLTEGVTEGQLFDRTVTTHGGVGNIFRLFTDPHPTCNSILDMRLQGDGLSELTLATDGSCLNNGERSARAGSGVFVGDGDPRNKSIRLPSTLNQSNQTGEAVATYIASATTDP